MQNESTNTLLPDASLEASGPPIEVSFFLCKDTIRFITLSSSNQFTCHIHSTSPNLQKKIFNWITAYLAKKAPPFVLPLDLSALTLFTQAGLQAIAAIPFGQTASYKEIAKRSGSPRATRAIGGVCNRNPFPLVIPCHRVIAADGTLGGFAYPQTLKQDLLAFESFTC